jgi:Arc/MetJ family transcription regulator
MRTTLDLDNEIVSKAMEITGDKTKTAVIHRALNEIIKKDNTSKIFNYGGKVNIDIDLDVLRGRNSAW